MTERLAARMGSVWAAAALLVPAFAVVKQPIPPHDVWWQLAYGRAISVEHAVPRVDAFSFTRAGEAFFDQPWLAQLAMYGVVRAGGIAALVCAQALVVACAMGLLVLAARARTEDAGAAARGVLLFALPLSIDNWGLRPQTWALVPFAAYLLVLARWRAGRSSWAVWLLPIAMLAWVNVHGSFVLGLVLVALALGGWGLERALKRDVPSPAPIALGGALAAAATLANPRGLAVYGYVTNLVRHPSLERVVEWGTTSRVLPVVALVMGLLLLASKKRPSVTEIVMLVAMLALGLRGARSAMWVGAVGGVVLAAPLAEWLRFDGARKVPFGRAAIAIGAALVLLRSPLALGRVALEDTPAAAVDALRAMNAEERPARLFASEGSGSYLMWAAPEQKTFVDTRIELFPPSLWDEWVEVERAEDAATVQAILDRYAIDGVLASKEHEGPIARFVEDRGWERRWQDAGWAIFVRPQSGRR